MAAYGSHSGTTYASRTNTTITAPVGIADGNDLLQYFVLAAGSAASIPTPTWPSGFSVIAGPVTVSQNNDPAAFSVRSWLLRKRALSESGDYQTLHSSASSDGVIVCVTNGLDATPVVTVNDGDGAGDITFLSLTTVDLNAYIAAFCHNWNLWGAGEPPSGATPTFTERQDLAASLIHFSDATWASSGATGNKTKDSDNAVGADQWAAMLVAIEPDIPEPPPPAPVYPFALTQRVG
jgi:hypothetical protein